MKGKQKKLLNEVKQLLKTAVDTPDVEEAEDIFITCNDMLNSYHIRDRKLIDDAREKRKFNDLSKRG